jgi:hypothetical protein
MNIIVFSFLLLLFSGEALASPGMPMVKGSLANGDDLAVRIQTGNGLEVGADYVSAFQAVRPEMGVRDKAAAIAVAKDLHPCNPPAGRYLVSRVKNGTTSTRERHVSSQEPAFCDDSNNVVVLAKCGNVARPVASPPRVAELPQPVMVVEAPPPDYRPNFVGWNRGYRMSPAEISRAFEDCPDGSSCGQWHQTGRTLGAAAIIGGSMVGTGAVLPAARTTVNTTVNGVRAFARRPHSVPVISPPSGGGPVNPPEYPPSNADGSPINPGEYPGAYWE